MDYQTPPQAVAEPVSYQIAQASPPPALPDLYALAPMRAPSLTSVKSSFDFVNAVQAEQSNVQIRLDTSFAQAVTFGRKNTSEIGSRLALVSPQVQTTIAAMAISQHFKTKFPFNETNPGIGVDIRLWEKYGIAVGTYENSFNRGSFYVMGYLDQPLFKVFDRVKLSAGGFLGMVNGYQKERVYPFKKKEGFDPIFTWQASVVDKTGFGVRFLAIPSGEGLNDPRKLLKPKVMALQVLAPTQIGGWNVGFQISLNKRLNSHERLTGNMPAGLGPTPF